MRYYQRRLGGALGVRIQVILFCPAVYNIKAFDVPFDERFTDIIRRENSWMQSDAFDILQKFSGNALIFIGEKDEVIPQTLLSMIDASLVNVSSKEIVRIPDCPHTIHRWLAHHPVWAKKVAEKIDLFLLT